MTVFYPYPIIKIAKAVIIALVVSAVLFLIRGYFSQYLLAIIVLWALVIVHALTTFALARTRSLSVEGGNLAYRSGVISVQTSLLPISKITAANFNQTLVERLFGVGTIKIDTQGGNPIMIGSIKSSDKKQILDLISGK